VGDVASDEKVQQLVAHILSEASFDGQAQLTAQIPYLRIREGPVTFLRLATDRSAAPRSTFERGPVPGSAWVFGADGSPTGTMLLWVDDGYISALECAWVTDDPPTELPRIDQIHLGKE
jgi:hypothetical protein